MAFQHVACGRRPQQRSCSPMVGKNLEDVADVVTVDERVGERYERLHQAILTVHVRPFPGSPAARLRFGRPWRSVEAQTPGDDVLRDQIDAPILRERVGA